MKNIVCRVLLFLLTFTLIIRPEFEFIPLGINKFFGFIGILVYNFDRSTRSSISRDVNISFRPFLNYLLPPLVWSLISLVLNSSTDFYFPAYVISMILAFYAAYFIAWAYTKVYGTFTYEKFSEYIIIACVVYAFITVVGFINPSFFNSLLSLIRLDSIAEQSIERTEGTRLIGIGANFFTSALVNGFILIILGTYIAYEKRPIFQNTLLFFAFVIIGTVSLMMARTSLFGIIIGGFFIIFSFIKSVKNFIKYTLIALILAVLARALASFFFNSYFQEFDTLTSFAFEMFINKSEGGRFESHSMMHLYEMWETLPKSLHTWIIGDALWETNDGYYQGVDLGYLRHLWYFGIVGVLLLIRYYYKTIYVIIYKKHLFAPLHKWLFVSLLFFIIILNAKGPCDLFIYIIPYYFCKSNFST